jgi:hypothetical protein
MTKWSAAVRRIARKNAQRRRAGYVYSLHTCDDIDALLTVVGAIAMAPDREANGDLPVPQDCQARPEGIAK